MSPQEWSEKNRKEKVYEVVRDAVMEAIPETGEPPENYDLFKWIWSSCAYAATYPEKGNPNETAFDPNETAASRHTVLMFTQN